VRAAPLTAVSAPKMGSGKTLLSHLAAYIATGRAPALMSQAENAEEEKKRLLALLLEGAIVTVIDNVERPLKSDALCTALTETVIRDRILGSTRTISVPTTTTWVATGNALTVDGDLSSRTLLCTLDPRCERPEERSFKVDLHVEVPKRRGELAMAALTIVRAYLAAGEPRQDVPTFGRFEAWSRFVRQPLVWLGCADPCETRRAIEARDPVRDQLGNLLEAWHGVFGDRAETVSYAISKTDAAHQAESAADKSKDASFEALRSLRNALEAVGLDRGGRLNGRMVGKFLSKHESRIERGYRADQAGSRQGVALWSVGLVGFRGFPYTHARNCQHTKTGVNDSFTYRVKPTHETTTNPPNGHDAGTGACAHCDQEIPTGTPFTATSDGAYLHNACVDARARGGAS
jgi:hypothetical protein